MILLQPSIATSLVMVKVRLTLRLTTSSARLCGRLPSRLRNFPDTLGFMFEAGLLTSRISGCAVRVMLILSRWCMLQDMLSMWVRRQGTSWIRLVILCMALRMLCWPRSLHRTPR